MKNTKLMLTRKWTPAVEAELSRTYTTVFNIEDIILSQDEIIKRCHGVDILCPTITDQIDEAQINALPESIKLIACFGVGVDYIDVAVAAKRNILVSNTPGSVVEDTADLAFGLIIATARRFSEGDRVLRTGGWERFAINFMLGKSIHGKTLGIIGLGDIGKAVARRAQGFNMNVIYHSRERKLTAEQELGLTYMDELDDLLERADIISLHCALTANTHHLINKDSFEKMKSSAIIINTARGPVIDEVALINALREKQIAAAGIDVYENEPHVPEELIKMSNTVLIPHLGTASIEARDAMGFQVMRNIKSFLETGEVIDRVQP